MKKIVFNSCEAMAVNMIENACDGKITYTILFYDEAIEVMRHIISLSPDISFGGINITPVEYNGYDKEYFVVLSDDLTLDIEPAWHEKNQYHNAGYLGFDSDLIYIDSNANHDVLKDIELYKCYDAFIDEDNPHTEHEECCERCKREKCQENESESSIDLIDAIFALLDI